ncbi:PREDICTED: solute carrier family 35 member C2 [Drosophila arizonae]|uniref:Solute carrier family 35 member C2 n=1 Tax=Drosophila arizonae TaxID=7263 RepID=A0ABM1P6L5_DROAR|nr:PREDICTED: solute carrier family 35 member C2 [Drosophila arizonae]XP_017862851.1 PREDICTED: solute carrier family 35 member C2 [Drosophila arizonae]
MVAPKYERLSTGDGDVDAGSDIDGGSNIEELELSADLTHKNANNIQERRQLSSHTNFQYAKNNSNGDAATSAQQSHSHPHDGMTRHAEARFMQMAIGTLATILLYLSLSITLTFYQTDINRELPFPLTIVTYHLIVKFLLAALVRSIYKMRVGKTRVQLDWRVAVRRMAPTGVASGIDIGFSNWGLALVPISLYTMTKSSTIVFILLFAILLGLERKSWSLVLIVGLIGLGLFMFTYKSTQFNTLGFLFILFASLSSGVRWSFAQFIMQKSKLGLHNPIDMIYHMQPWMIVSLFPLVLSIEGPKLYAALQNLHNTPESDILWVLARITLGAFIAFFMEVSEFLVLCKTSSLTLSIAGIFKDICQLALAVALKGDQLSPINLVGLAVCLAGIACHLVHKYSTLAKVNKQQLGMQLEEDGEDMCSEYDFNKGNAIVGAHGNASGSHGTLTVPLLEQTDSEDESANDSTNKQNASDVIFDVLKRRDMQR